ncbi:hypothetical protein D9613_004145 [Agrocybe pediades]|uniref:Ras GEF n=1 Tax=Agrocybe pediades TaxID=84607 RepID=A0A8H4QJL6_9AGAR|nr:hypothetical protein D9613_004145 [Agrocybe pediades]
MASLTRSQAVCQAVDLHITPASYNSCSDTFLTPEPSSIPAPDSTPEEPDTIPSSQMPDSIIFSVLCMYDYTGEEPGLLSFKKNQILDIVKRDDTGWWAAMAEGGTVVGWIPQAFVSPLSAEMAKRLRNVREEVRVAEFEAERLYDSAPFEINIPSFDVDSTNTSPSLEGYEVYMTRTIVTPSQNTFDEYPTRVAGGSRNLGPPQVSRRPSRLRAPPSPASPMPFPPSSSLDKPVPPTPPPTDDTLRKKRSIKRRPLVVNGNDNSTLARLNTLIQSKDVNGINKLATPDISGSFGSISRRFKEDKMQRKKTTENMKQTDRNKALPSSPGGKPRYLRLVYEDQIDEDDKGHIRSATIPALIERLTTHVAITDATKLIEYTNFTKVFLTTFRTFLTANRLFELLVDRFNMKTPKSLTDPEYKEWRTTLREPVRRRILEIFGLWLENYRLLEEEPHIAQRMTDFLSTLKPPYSSIADALIKDIDRLTFTVPQDLSAFDKMKKSSKKIKFNRNDLLKLSPTALAEQLALYEHSFYVKITPQECLSYAKTQKGESVRRLVDFCSTHDKLAGWVKGSVLTTEVLLKRAETIDFWVKVAEKSRSLNNFASMSAIITALSSTVLTNLHMTWVHVKRQSQLDALLQHSAPNGGFAGYRALLAQAEGPCVPFITMYLTDIMRAQEQFAPNDGRILFYQRARWYEIISNMLKFQSRKYSISPSESMAAFMDIHLRGVPRDEEWFWTKSQEVQRIELAHADIRKGLEAAGF